MIGDIGIPELLIILAVVMLLFGAGKISSLGKDLGTSVKEFRKAIKDEDAEKAQPAPQATPTYQVLDAQPQQYVAQPQPPPYAPPPAAPTQQPQAQAPAQSVPPSTGPKVF